MTSNETNQENNMKSYLIRESEKVFLSLSPVSVLFSIRSLTEKKTLKKELKWAKQSNGLMPETEEEIPVEGTVGGKAVKERKMIHVPNIAEEPLFHPRGREYVNAGYLTSTAFPIFGPEGEVVGVMQVYTDKEGYALNKKEQAVIQSFCNTVAFPILIKKFKEKALEAERFKLIGEHAASIAHHMKNKLAPIGGFAKRAGKITQKAMRCVAYIEKRVDNPLYKGLLSRSFNYMKKIIFYCDIIVNEVTKLEAILKDIMNFNQNIIKKEFTDIISLTEKILENFKRENPSIKIIRDIRTSGNINADPAKIELVLVELLKNAQDAARNSGEHNIELVCRIGDYKKKGRDSIKIEIENRGEIPEHLRSVIFDPFMTTKNDGTGLGLSSAMTIVKSHDGKIKVKSGYGKTIVRVYLPRPTE